jgi:ABC-type nitrate/sulfonate/bicarbonate transport system substrate-binding protein
VRRSAIAALALLAGCGGVQGSSQFGEVPIVVGSGPDTVGVVFAIQRGYDEAEGVELKPSDSGDFRITDKPSKGCIAVLAIVQPDKLVLCVDEVILQDERPKVEAVAAALTRGYTQAQLEPDEAAAAANTDANTVEDAAPRWTAGAKRFGELKPGPGRDPIEP